MKIDAFSANYEGYPVVFDPSLVPVPDFSMPLRYAAKYVLTDDAMPDLAATRSLFYTTSSAAVTVHSLGGMASVQCLSAFWCRSIDILEFKVVLRCTPPSTGGPSSVGYTSLIKVGPAPSTGVPLFSGQTNVYDVIGYAFYQYSTLNGTANTIYGGGAPNVQGVQVYGNETPGQTGFVLDIRYELVPVWAAVGTVDWVVSGMANLAP